MLIEDRDRKLLGAIALYQRHRDRKSPLSRLKCAWGKLGHVLYSLLGACDISREARIDPGTRFPHPTGIVIHRDAVIGPDCLIMQQVTLGQLAQGGAPRIGRGVYLGAGARILGPVHVGDGARVGACVSVRPGKKERARKRTQRAAAAGRVDCRAGAFRRKTQSYG